MRGKSKTNIKTPVTKVKKTIPNKLPKCLGANIISSKNKKEKNVVLDLDETLVHVEVHTKANPKLAKMSDFQFKLYGQYYYIFKRPGLEDFLITVFKNFDNVAVWTTGVAPYAKNILKHILTKDQAEKLAYVYTRGQCPRDQFGYYKPLKKLWTQKGGSFKKNNTVMVDNSQIVMRDNLEHGIVAPDFDMKNLKDQYLPWLTKKIKGNLKNLPATEFVKYVNKNTKI